MVQGKEPRDPDLDWNRDTFGVHTAACLDLSAVDIRPIFARGRACEQSVSGAEIGVERAGNGVSTELERSAERAEMTRKIR